MTVPAVRFSIIVALATLGGTPAALAADVQFECYAEVHDACFLPADEEPCSKETYESFLAACDAEAEDAKAVNFNFGAPKALSSQQRQKFVAMKRFLARKGLR